MNNWIKLLQKLKRINTPIALVTVSKTLGSTPCKVASKMIVTPKKIYGTIGGGKLEFKVIEEAKRAIQENKIKQVAYTLGPEFEQCCGGKVELIIEPMNQSPKLFLFGAGHIGMELCEVMQGTPFEIVLLDTRKKWKKTLSFNDSITYCDKAFKKYKKYISWGENAYLLIMTHDHKLDFKITALALENKTKYIGLIGSKTKNQKFNNLLKKEMNFKDGIAPVHCPVGLDIGGFSPKEIAISIAAELLKVHYEK